MTKFFLADRSFVRVAGEDASTFLGGLLTNMLPAAGEQRFSCLLTPQGKILFDFIVSRDGDGFLLDVRRSEASSLVKRLTLYRLRAKVTIEPVNDANVVWSSSAAAGLTPDPRLSALGFRGIGRELNGEGGDAIYHARRIRLCVPECGADFAADTTFPMDVNYDVLNGVSYSKGCFVGQEVASRMKRKGEVRKRALSVSAVDGAILANGAEVRTETSTLGALIATDGADGVAVIRLDRYDGAVARGETIHADGAPVRLTLPHYLDRA